MSKTLLERLEGVESPYFGAFTIASKANDFVTGDDAGAPILRVVKSDIQKITAIHFQVLKVSDDNTSETAYLRRFVVELEKGGEIDLVDPMVMDASVAETGIDTSKCEACTLKIDATDLVIQEGSAYHNYCLESDGDNVDS